MSRRDASAYGSTALFAADFKDDIAFEQIVDARLWFSTGSAFVTGWVNAVFFIRYSAFASMMSGNVLMLGISISLQLLSWLGHEQVDPDSHWLSKVPPPSLYILTIAGSVAGAMLYRLLVKHRQWTPGTFGPLIVLVAMLHEGVEHFLYGKELHIKTHVTFFAPLCGIMNSIALDGLIVKQNPYCTTANIMLLGHTAADVVTGEASYRDKKACINSLCMFLAVQLGILCGLALDLTTGEYWDFELTVIAPCCAMLYYLHDHVQPSTLLPLDLKQPITGS